MPSAWGGYQLQLVHLLLLGMPHVLQNCPRGMCPTAAKHSTWSRLADAPASPLCLPVLPLSPSLSLSHSLLIAYINVTTCLCRKRVARFRFDVQRVVRAALCMRSTLFGGLGGGAGAGVGVCPEWAGMPPFRSFPLPLVNQLAYWS